MVIVSAAGEEALNIFGGKPLPPHPTLSPGGEGFAKINAQKKEQ
jgi:hypothetical protein